MPRPGEGVHHDTCFSLGLFACVCLRVFVCDGRSLFRVGLCFASALFATGVLCSLGCAWVLVFVRVAYVCVCLIGYSCACERAAGVLCMCITFRPSTCMYVHVHGFYSIACVHVSVDRPLFAISNI